MTWSEAQRKEFIKPLIERAEEDASMSDKVDVSKAVEKLRKLIAENSNASHCVCYTKDANQQEPCQACDEEEQAVDAILTNLITTERARKKGEVETLRDEAKQEAADNDVGESPTYYDGIADGIIKVLAIIDSKTTKGE